MYLGNRCTRPIIALPLSPLDDNFPRFPGVTRGGGGGGDIIKVYALLFLHLWTSDFCSASENENENGESRKMTDEQKKKEA